MLSNWISGKSKKDSDHKQVQQRIDIISVQEEEDEYEEQIQKTNEKDYEASFPGTD